MKWIDEVRFILDASVVYGVDPYFIAAIRRAENGGPGREYGVISVAAPSYEEQLDVCCKSVRNKLIKYTGNPLTLYKTRAGYGADFIGFFQSTWAPIGAENDPNGLNKNWVGNVTKIYEKFMRGGLVCGILLFPYYLVFLVSSW